jgi:hypothetical protein
LHYYGKKLEINTDVIATVPTSDIINFIVCHQIDPDYKFEKFEKYIMANIKGKSQNN